MNISRDKQDFWSKVWQQKLCDLRISRGQFFAPYFGGQKLDLYAEKYSTLWYRLDERAFIGLGFFGSYELSYPEVSRGAQLSLQ